MDAIVQGPPGDGGTDLIDTSNGWNQNGQNIANNNSTYLYIAVEYVKDEYKMEQNGLPQPTDTFGEFEQHVSPLDPNMSSVAHYSPVYNEPSTEFNPIVIHQLVQPDTNASNDIINNLTTNSLEPMPVLCNNDIRDVVENQFLQLNDNPSNTAQLGQENEETQVALLITDQETGISYSVRPQEFLVERCLDDEQLLNALTPDPLLESDLLTLDENTLKTELNDDDIMNADVTSSVVDSNVVNNYISSLTNDNNIKTDNDDQFVKIETRRQKNNDIEFEDQLLSKVYSIIDKPVLSRARATLPEQYLVFNKVDTGIGVFAKRSIPKRTQFGPLTGLETTFDSTNFKEDPKTLIYLIENENGIVNQLDVSDENISNWMSFVRKATTYDEQNLVLSQEGNGIYFTTTKNVLPKDELKVGYSVSYAQRYQLQLLTPPEDRSWQCFECFLNFTSSDELQKHLNIHDDELKIDNNITTTSTTTTTTTTTKQRKKIWKNNKKKIVKSISNNEALKCNNCNELFIQPAKVALRNHLIEKHLMTRFTSIDEHFSFITNYCKCTNCDAIFASESLMKIHNLTHNSDNSDEQTNHICPSCQKKFPTQRQLISHVAIHNLVSVKTPPQPETFKCIVCHKTFALRERLRRHMLVHGSDESKPLQCKTCNKRFLNNSALAGHLKTHFVGKKVFECPICKESFDHVLKLKLHVPKHCENNLYSCPHCPKVSKKYSMIRKHIRAFHCDQKHPCPHCSKMFPTLDKLKMHLLRHSDHREFLCADCGKQFKRKDKLKEHCKRMHSEERENDAPHALRQGTQQSPRKISKVEPTDFHRFIYKCHTCLVGFKRRGMLVNHLAKRHPDISPDSVPELNLPILQTTRDYYCQHCDKVYKSSSKRKAHILKNHPGAALPMSNRKQGSYTDNSGLPNPTFSQTVGSITTRPQSCNWCHKQYASKAKLLQHQRKKHSEQLAQAQNVNVKLLKLIVQNQGANNNENNNKDDDNDIENQHLSDFKSEFKVNESEILDNALKEYTTEREGEQFCHLVAIATTDAFQNDLAAPNSHLYRLLTTSNGLVPPR